jgi:hypothetical protein
MPPQKNSGNRGSKRESGVSTKNRRFIGNLLDDLRTEGKCEDVYIARVTKKLGNGRVEVFYTQKNPKTNEHRAYTQIALIRGSFRGKGKHSVWIDTGSVVAVADTGVGLLEIMAVLTREQLRDISKEIELDSRVLNGDNVETKSGETYDPGFEFSDNSSENEEEEPVVQKKDKPSHHVEKKAEPVSDDDIDIDDI